MPVSISSFLLPKNGNTYFLLEDKYIKGGYQVRATHAERDSINPLNKKPGMLVRTMDDGKMWVLGIDLSWSPFSTGGSVPRESLSVTAEVDALSQTDLDLPVGSSALILELSTSGPCMVEIHSTVFRNDSNPYRFVSVADHYTDDGSTILSDGTVVYGRRYSIVSNLEDPPQPLLYLRVLNSTTQAISIDLGLLYQTLEN